MLRYDIKITKVKHSRRENARDRHERCREADRLGVNQSNHHNTTPRLTQELHEEVSSLPFVRARKLAIAILIRPEMGEDIVDSRFRSDLYVDVRCHCLL